MNNVELYQSSNQLQKRDVISFMNEYSTKIKWKKNLNRVLDIGCGDGDATNILKTYIPSDYTLLGCDVNEKMVKHANSCHANDQVSFRVLDIQGNLPEELKGSFVHVFSFFALHWVSNQERAFTNIYELLSSDGDCFMIFVAYAPTIDVYRIMAQDHKWKSWLHDLNSYTILRYSETQVPCSYTVHYINTEYPHKTKEITGDILLNYSHFWDRQTDARRAEVCRALTAN